MNAKRFTISILTNIETQLVETIEKIEGEAFWSYLERTSLDVLETALPKETEKRIYRLFAICTFLATASLIVPRFVSNPEGGFAGAASAILTLLITLGASLFFSLYLLAVTVQKYSNLSTAAKIAGIAPSVVLAATLFGLLGFLSY